MFIFSLAAILLPLFPLLALFIRNTFHQPGMPLLAFLCLIAFFRETLLTSLASLPVNTIAINAIFNIAEMIALVFLFRSVFRSAQVKQYFNLSLISILSVILTVYALEGVALYSNKVEVFLSIIIVLLSLLSIYQIIINEQVSILHSPLFWIAGGTLGYFAMFLLSEGLKNIELRVSRHSEVEQFILLKAIYIVRYVFYIIAVFMARFNLH